MTNIRPVSPEVAALADWWPEFTGEADRNRLPWSEQDDLILTTGYRGGLSNPVLARLLRRTVRAIENRALFVGLTEREGQDDACG